MKGGVGSLGGQCERLGIFGWRGASSQVDLPLLAGGGGG